MRTKENGKSTDVSFTSAALEDGAIQLAKALWAKYKDVNGTMKVVGGDFTKVKYVPSLTEAAKVLLRNIEHSSRSLPGTQETRRMMRFATQAYRIKYGTPIFVTFSPDESHNLLMIRSSRTRRSDPVFKSKLTAHMKKYAAADCPDLATEEDDILLQASVEDILDMLPSHDVRRQILATEALASVEGFRVMVHLTFQHLFGTLFGLARRNAQGPGR